MALLDLVRFCIPTIGRPSLGRALESISAQTEPHWSAVVVADGLDTPALVPYVDQERYGGSVIFSSAPKTGSAGLTRDFAIDYALDLDISTCFVGFLDDDDEVMPTYVERVDQINDWYGGDPPAIIVFRMRYHNGITLPSLDDHDPLRWGHVGISFAVRTDVLRDGDLRFGRETLHSPGPEGNEDIRFLRTAKRLGLDIHVDHTTQYLVRPR